MTIYDGLKNLICSYLGISVNSKEILVEVCDDDGKVIGYRKVDLDRED